MADEAWMPPESHRMQPDHHPTPFSAAQIRDGFVIGREVRTLVVRAGEAPYVLARRNLAADAETGTYEVLRSPSGVSVHSDPEHGGSSFLELHGHASMPIDATTIEPVEVDVPMGRFEGLLYRRVDGDKLDAFWFARARPGAPLRFEFRVGAEVVFESTALSERNPGS